MFWLGCGDDAGGEAAALTDAATPSVDAMAADGGPTGDAGRLGPDAGVAQVLDTVDQALDAVDPFIGSGGLAYNHGATAPSAQLPLGFVRLGPDTSVGKIHVPFHHFSGYHYDDPDVRGFSHVRLMGTGASDLGLLRMLPVDERPLPKLDDIFMPFDKASEAAGPGWYESTLTVPAVQVELVASVRAGWHRYTALDGALRLLVDARATNKDEGIELASLRFEGATFEGRVRYKAGLVGRGNVFEMFFAGRFNRAPLAIEPTIEAPEGAAVVVFEPGPVELRVGLSMVDLQAARENRDGVEGQTGEDLRAVARAAWAEKLSRALIAGGTERQRRIFYTAQYHAYAMPTTFGEADGRYRGLDGAVHTAEGFNYLTDMSLWDTFRTTHPWFIMTDPDVQRDVLDSLMAMYADGGDIPRWPAGASYGGSMIGSSADMLFAGSLLKGVDGVDYEAAFDALMGAANGPRPHGGRAGIERYLELGYLPASIDCSVACTLEFAYSDAALASMALALGRPEAEDFIERSGYYRNLFNPRTLFFGPRDEDGAFLDDNPEVVVMGQGAFVEGSARHWRYSVFHDPDGLVELFGGVDVFHTELTQMFEESGLAPGKAYTPRLPDTWYWHGNEPTLHIPYLWRAAGDADAGADWVRAIQRRAYGDGPDGLAGNDDGGTLSGWYLFSALGFYPVAGQSRYVIGTPLFPEAVVSMGDHTLRIVAPGASDERRYVRAVYLDDVLVEGDYLEHADLAAAQELRFELAPRP